MSDSVFYIRGFDAKPVSTIFRMGNESVFTIYPDGRIEINPKYSADDAAKAFWAAVERLAPVQASEARDTVRLDWLVDNHALIETDGLGHWRIHYNWTSPDTYGPWANDQRTAIESAIAAHTQAGAGG